MEALGNFDFNQQMREQSNLLASATETLKQVQENVCGLLQDIAQLSSKNEREQATNLNEFEHYQKKVAEYIEHVHVEIPALMNGKSCCWSSS
jgi:hypothetical protein